MRSLTTRLALKRPSLERTAIALVSLLAGACTAATLEPAPDESGGWDTLEDKVETCDPLSPDPCERIICSVATTVSSCQDTSGSSLCETVLECADAYYRCMCPDDEFDADAAQPCGQTYDACLLDTVYHE